MCYGREDWVWSSRAALSNALVEPVWMRTLPCPRRHAALCQDSMKYITGKHWHWWMVLRSSMLESLRSPRLLGTSLYRSLCRRTWGLSEVQLRRPSYTDGPQYPLAVGFREIYLELTGQPCWPLGCGSIPSLTSPCMVTLTLSKWSS